MFIHSSTSVMHTHTHKHTHILSHTQYKILAGPSFQPHTSINLMELFLTSSWKASLPPSLELLLMGPPWATGARWWNCIWCNLLFLGYLYPFLWKCDSLPRISHLLLIFQDIVSVVIFSDIVFRGQGGGPADFQGPSPGSCWDYSVLISSSAPCDSTSMQETYNHVSLIRREWSLISGLEELKIYVKLITEQMSSQFGSSGKKKKSLITLKTSMLSNANPGSFYSRVKRSALISSTTQN